MEPILFQKEGPIAWIIFNDPERLNALTDEMGKEIARLVTVINQDKSIRVVIITGAGRAFSAGGNLDIIMARAKKKAGVNQREMIYFYHQFLSIAKIQVPVIAMINGPAIGAAFCMTLACDLRIASTEARMGVNFVKIGISPGMAGTFLLPQVLGIPLASELLLTGRTLGAEEAERRGIVHRILPPDQLKDETLKIAHEIATNAPMAIQVAKAGIKRHLKDLEKALVFESKGQARCFQTQDILEGIEAIRAKRPPAFSGK